MKTTKESMRDYLTLNGWREGLTFSGRLWFRVNETHLFQLGKEIQKAFRIAKRENKQSKHD